MKKVLDSLGTSGYNVIIMNAPATEMTTAPKSFTCGKCDGKGRLNWTRVADGVCFWCKGTGRIQNRDITNDKWYRMQIGNLMYTAEIAMWGEFHGREDYCDHYLRAMIADMMKVGTEGAREVLRHIRKCDFHMDSSGDRGMITDAQATRLINRLIELGRAARGETDEIELERRANAA